MKAHRDWKGIRDFITTRDTFIITTHVNPDGDAIGSEMAICHYLLKAGKKVFVLNSNPTPKFYRFLDPDNIIHVFDKDQHAEVFNQVDGCIVLDVSDWNRLRDIGQVLLESNLPVICIDHHVQSDRVGEIQVMDQTASSTGEMLYDFFTNSDIEITTDIANALYTCILTDTGSFRFSNTTPHAHNIAASLIEKGADFRSIYRKVYESYSVERMRVIGEIWANMHFEFDNKLAWYTVTRAMLDKNGLDQSELEGFSELPRVVEGVEVNLVFAEIDNEKIKISLRSKGSMSILELARKFSGGGHKYAAGAVVNGPLKAAQERVLAEVRSVFQNPKVFK